MATEPAPSAVELQARIAHLTFVQGIIARMAGYSSTLKNFSVTATLAIVVFALDKRVPEMWYAALAAIIAFMILDAYYLAQERAFRRIYEGLASRAWANSTDMKIEHSGVGLMDVLSSLASASVWLFYVPMLIGIAVLIWSGPHVPSAGGR